MSMLEKPVWITHQFKDIESRMKKTHLQDKGTVTCYSSEKVQEEKASSVTSSVRRERDS